MCLFQHLQNNNQETFKSTPAKPQLKKKPKTCKKTVLFASLSTGTSQVFQKNFQLLVHSQFITFWQKLPYYLTEPDTGDQITMQIAFVYQLGMKKKTLAI